VLKAKQKERARNGGAGRGPRAYGIRLDALRARAAGLTPRPNPAVVAQHKGNESGVAGVDWASRTLEQTNGTVIEFAAAAEPGSPDFYLKQAWGAYGAAYASQLFEIGIFAEAKKHTIPVPGEKIGDRTASAFAEGLSSLATPYLAAIRNGKVSRTELERLAPITPSAIPEDSDERTCYENILFANAGIERPDDIDRRRSLQLLLAVTKQKGRVPGIFDVRWILYAGYHAQNHPLQLPGVELIAQRWRWWVYQANDLLHVCYEGLLKYSLDVLGEYPAGISLSRLIGECTARLIKARDDKADNWKTFRESYPAPQNCLLPDDQSGEFYFQRELIRRTRPDGLCEAADAMLAVKLLAVLHNRIRSSPKPGVRLKAK
jgi:hypothetical protein